MKKILCSAMLLAFSPLFAAGPDPQPPFESADTARQNVKLSINSFIRDGRSYSQPNLMAGNKRLAVRDLGPAHGNNRFRPDRSLDIHIFIDELPCIRLSFWGTHKGGCGFPFPTSSGGIDDLTINESENQFTIRRKYSLPEGENALFTCTFQGLPDGKVEIGWDLGIPQEKLDRIRKEISLVFSPWITLNHYREHDLLLNGKKVEFKEKEQLLKNKGKELRSLSGGSRIEISPGSPMKSIALELPEAQIGISESLNNNIFTMLMRAEFKKMKSQDKIIIDFGKVGINKKSTPPPVGGIDFWKRDAIHVPLSPVRNLMPNPSFEQGLRYWGWMGGGAVMKKQETTPRYSIDRSTAKFGSASLLISPVASTSAAMLSFPVPMKKNTRYTLSFYAKAEKTPQTVCLGFFSTTVGGKFPREYSWQKKFTLNGEWQRFSYSDIADGAGTSLVLGGNGSKIWIDGIQLEEGEHATEFVVAPLEGNLQTSDPDNLIEYGSPLKASFSVVGERKQSAEVVFSLFNFYKEQLFQKTCPVPENGNIPLPFDRLKLGRGIYILRADYKVPGFKTYSDYCRFTVVESLKGKHATKNLFATLAPDFYRISRNDDVGRLWQRMGFGSTDYTDHPFEYSEQRRIMRKYGIENLLTCPQPYFLNRIPEEKTIRDFLSDWRKLKEVTPETEKKIEEIAFRAASKDPGQKFWAFSTEEEGNPMVRANRFEEWIKVPLAFARGVRRANPDAKLFPSGGTSGWSLLRGYTQMEGYLNASQGKIKWDAIAVHPYWDLDGTKGFEDLDVEIQRLIDLMKKYGYGKETGIYFTEGFNIPSIHVPEWNANLWGDSYQGLHPGYDLGLREFVHASLTARTYLICLKYWPQVKQFNIWQYPVYLDQHLTPKAFCLAVNTLGRFLNDPVYIADIRPANGVRGYAFRNKTDNTGIVSLWCAMDRVEDGFERGPILKIKFDGTPPELMDLMGNRVNMTPEKDGFVHLRLTPAPLFLKGKDPVKLAEILNGSEVIGSDSNLAVSFIPSLKGSIHAVIRNLTGREQKGMLETESERVEFTAPPASRQEKALLYHSPYSCGKVFHWTRKFRITQKNGSSSEKIWNMDYFYVPYTKNAPDWNKIPAIPVSNVFYGQSVKPENRAAVPSANFQAAWNEKGFYLRVTVEDPNFMPDTRLFERPDIGNLLYCLDGSLEVYFDCGANGRTNVKKGYDQDDYRYDFSYGNPQGKSGRGLVNRLRAVNWQFAGGLSMPTKEQANKEILCEFTRTPNGFRYDISFEPKYLEPIRLEPGFISGFALFLHKRDKEKYAALSTACENGAPCDYNPHLWPLMILAE